MLGELTLVVGVLGVLRPSRDLRDRCVRRGLQRVVQQADIYGLASLNRLEGVPGALRDAILAGNVGVADVEAPRDTAGGLLDVPLDDTGHLVALNRVHPPL